MQLGVFAKTFPGTDPDTVLAAASGVGVTTVHYNMVCSGLSSLPAMIAPEVAGEVSAAARTHRVEICGVSGTFNMAHPDPHERQRGLERLEVIAGSADLIGTDLITLCTGSRDADDRWRAHPDNSTPEAWRDVCEVMSAAVAIAERYDIRLGVEPESANVVNSAAAAMRLIDELQSDRIRIVFDPANVIDVHAPDAQRRIVSSALDLVGDLLTVAHAKDRALDGSPTPPGSGVVDFEHYVTELQQIGFVGPLVAHGFAAGDASDALRFLRRQLGSP